MSLVRINFNDTSAYREELETLRLRSRSSSLAQFIRMTVKVFKVILEAHENGHSVTINKKTGEKEVIKIIT